MPLQPHSNPSCPRTNNEKMNAKFLSLLCLAALAASVFAEESYDTPAETHKYKKGHNLHMVNPSVSPPGACAMHCMLAGVRSKSMRIAVT